MSGQNSNTDGKQDPCICKKTCPPVRNVTHPLRYYEFTQDEMKALEECDKESFYQRCLPYSALFATMTYAAIKWGLMCKHLHFGVYPKVIMAALIGHCYGRLSYQQECDEKLRNLPANSNLGKIMRTYYAEKFPPPKK